MIPVHLFGLCAKMDPILEIARKHDLWVVEDAACALGAWQGGRHAGNFGDFGAFSFHPRKSVTTGEGGMLTTASDEWDSDARALRDHGADRTDFSRHHEPHAFLLSDFHRLGFNYRMTDIQGALGCVQMERADSILDERRSRAAAYDTALAEYEWLSTPTVPEGDIHGYQSYVCLFQPDEPTLDNAGGLFDRRNAMMQRLEERGIATRQGTHAAALTGYYADKYGLEAEQFPNAAVAEKLSVALPLFAGMTDHEQDLVVSELGPAFDGS
jgi:dTDP-4-amino-4,6-dideoxygalactose transaminase